MLFQFITSLQKYDVEILSTNRQADMTFPQVSFSSLLKVNPENPGITKTVHRASAISQKLVESDAWPVWHKSHHQGKAPKGYKAPKQFVVKKNHQSLITDDYLQLHHFDWGLCISFFTRAPNCITPLVKLFVANNAGTALSLLLQNSKHSRAKVQEVGWVCLARRPHGTAVWSLP